VSFYWIWFFGKIPPDFLFYCFDRYIPEQAPELSPEEKKRRQEKVEAIKKMLSETTPTITGNVSALR
jgi:hypothetical protein